MTGASIETTLALWASSLREVKKRMRPLFEQDRTALNAGLFVDGLLGDERRKTGWMRAEAAGDPGPWRQQAVLGRDRWDADGLRDMVRDYVTEHLADENAVLVIDETGFLKQGKASCGVARQYTGSAGKITNCQIGVFAAYVSRHGHAFIDRALYLPKGWTDDPVRLKATYVPDNVSFSTKPQLAVEMIERALAAGVPFRWVAGDSVYGVGDIERDLRQAGKGYVLGVNSNHWFASWGKPQRVAGTAEEIAKTQRRSDWRRLSAGAGTKGPRLHDWCYLELADLQGEDSNHHSQVLWTRGLLIRRNIANGDLAYFTTWCPAGTSIKTLVSVEGHRWAIEDSFETAKNEFGLDHNESRSWHGWHRHVSLVMLAFAMMAAIQHQANKPTPKKQSRAQRPDIPPHPLVDPGNPPHSPTSRAKTNSTCRHHRMVALAAGSSSRSTEISYQTKITAVMLVHSKSSRCEAASG
jgi:SRSO17 transposase